MINPELENRLNRIFSDLSQVRFAVAGRPESYTEDALILLDTNIGYAQAHIQSAIQILGQSPDLSPDIENTMTQLVVGIV